MVVSGNDPLESFLNSIQVVRNAFSPIESNFHKVTKSFEHCFNGASKKGSLNGRLDDASTELVATQLDLKKKSGQHIDVNGCDRRKKRVPIKIFVGVFKDRGGSNLHSNVHVSRDGVEEFNVNLSRKGLKERYGNDNGGNEDRSFYGNCMHLDVALSFLINGFVQAFPRSLKSEKKQVHKMSNEDRESRVKVEVKSRVNREIKQELKAKEGKDLPFEYFIGFVVDQFNHLPKFDVGVQENECKSAQSKPSAALINQFDHLKALFSILEGKRADVNGFFGNLKFARVGGVPSSMVGVPSVKDAGDDGINNAVNQEESGGISPQKLANGLLSIPLSNVERLRSTLSTVSLTELIELLPQIGRPSKEDHPDKKKLISVQDFFRYTEAEGKRFFLELDRDGDGQVTLEDLEVAMRKRKLPKRYAHEFMRRARSHLFSKSFGWKQFLSLMEQKEPTILRAYTSLCLSKSGTLQKSEILSSLQNAGLPANEDNAVAMMRFLNADTGQSISYGHFRNFMLLLPSERLQEDPRSIWFEAATVVAVPPPVEIPAGSVLKAALIGGLSCAMSTALMHPMDTIKTRVQASTLLTFPEILAKLPQLGVRGLYRGSVPAILGQFSSHGLRTGIMEASKLVLINVAPTLPELQVQSLASFCSTVLGTAVRIPCEVLKQRLQAGLFDNVGEAIVGTWRQDGPRGFFRGTGATLCREVPFYVAGMGLYAESKKAAQRLLGRELEPWETIAVGALSGGLAAVLTTPFDVIKTRTMTAPQGRSVTLSIVAVSILRHEGPLGLFKGAVPRFFWIAPLGAMNFAGYELARKAMDKNKNDETGEPLLQK
ncbi:mitochondrial substrate carrier family protein [Perilla frutescens var. hirtella]|uniref:Mitochondrial substrate carrier family protein n=1 Tax=Perilla frutescens var. hirtella TaxID=608512 RepID=A0AAD4PFJ9_PERFH|nr:mitochondrial substrate carrier family protein [Perilla frutescens var. hirtella]